MRAIALAALACALLATACSNPCQELGNRLCDCRPAGETKASCTDTVRAQISQLHPGSHANSICSDRLDTCHGPSNVEFCEWLEGRCGKAACGLSEEEISSLRTEPVDPTAAACQPDPTVATCAKICQ